jgi:glyoxylase-like metal-dependent hydrolase (beta-lactamase superfamily II)
MKNNLLHTLQFVLLAGLLQSSVSQAQGPGMNFATIEVATVQLEPNVYVLMGGAAQGNILVLTGPDGVFMVDSMYAQMHEKLLAALQAISDEKVKYVVNTHLHGDHTAGNTAFAQEGALIIAQANTRERMLAQSNPLPAAAIPVLAYEDSMTIHMNGETIDIFWPQPAHTDGDSIIYFRNANIMHVGDVPSSLRYPNIGVNDGGTVAGMMAAARLIMTVANPQTRIIAGHLGPVVGFAEIEQQLAMFETVSSRIQAMIAEGKTLEHILAARPTAEFDAARAAGAITADQFVTLVHTDLVKQAEQQ